jgi:hypothetical protein
VPRLPAPPPPGVGKRKGDEMDKENGWTNKNRRLREAGGHAGTAF